jgi:3-hydroxypropanoate dehydrogenase
VDTLVSEEQLMELWDLMKFGPTSANLFPLRIVWCRSVKAAREAGRID